jgi:hypothetical protein
MFDDLRFEDIGVTPKGMAYRNFQTQYHKKRSSQIQMLIGLNCNILVVYINLNAPLQSHILLQVIKCNILNKI